MPMPIADPPGTVLATAVVAWVISIARQNDRPGVTAGIGLPCPAGRFLVAEDRSAEGVRVVGLWRAAGVHGRIGGSGVRW
jgi:hypothetical protein